MRHDRATLVRWAGACAAALVVLAIGGGCGRKAPDFIPSSDTARQSLETALMAWADGKPCGRIPTASPPIQVVDNAWWKGQRLASYEILDEEPERAEGHYFNVRLRKSKPAKEETVRYVVTGRSPVWVYREEDYKNSQGWGGYK